MSGIFHNKIFLFALIFLVTENILAQPVADFSATPVMGCAPLLVKFTDLSTGNPTAWNWNLGNGTIANIQNPSTTYFIPGQYKITLTTTNSGGSGTLTKDKYITVHSNPAVNFIGVPASGCLPLRVTFTDQSSTASGSVSMWKWDFGDGSSDTLQNPKHTYTSSGTFDVTLQVKNSFGCSGAASKSKYINTQKSVTASFTNNIQSNCKPPITLNFQNLSTAPASATYKWDFGDNTGSGVSNPSHTYTRAGNFIVRLIASTGAGGCSDTIQKEITIGTVKADFTGPSAVCQGVSFPLTNTSSPFTGSVLWNFGDGTTSDALNPLKSYQAPGNYTIKMIADFGACRDSVSRSIDVSTKQSIAFSSPDTAGCKTPFTVNFTSNVPGANSYSWNFGDGTTSAEANPAHTYTVSGIFDVSLIATNSAGCRDTVKKVKYVKIQAASVTLPFLPLKNCVPFTYTFNATIASPDPVVKYSWDFGDGTTDSGKTPTHTFTLTGSYAITLSITTSSGCVSTTKILNGVIVGNKPAANFSATPLSACANIPINFTDLSTGNVNEWRWDFGDKSFSTAKNPAHIYLDTGFFKVSLIVRSSGCPDSITFLKYIYIKPPLSKIVIKSNCAFPFQKTFVDSSVGANAWEWDFGDGSISTLRNPPVHIYADTGNYAVSLKVFNFSTGCNNTSTRIVQVIREKAAFTASSTSICKGTSIYFKSQNNATKISNYNWTYGDGSPSQNVRDSVFHKYPVSGSFNARLIITDLLGCKDTLVKPSYINVTGPVAKFSSVTVSCLLADVNFIDSSLTDGLHPIVKWAWDFGDSTVETFTSPPFMHNYTKPGTYSIKLKVTDNIGCTDSLVRRNYLFISKPIAGFTTNDTATCPFVPVQFTSLSQGVSVTYLWNFGDGTTSSDANPAHQYGTADSFTVTLKITDRYGCTDSVQKINYVNVTLPKANFMLNDSISACPPFLVSFNNTSENYTATSWDFGDGNFSFSTNATHFYNTPGTYIVILRVTRPGGCFDEKFNTIVVKGPTGVLSYTNIAGCKSLQTDFRASASENLLFTWDFNDGTTVRTGDSLISHLYTQPGFYLPKLILEDSNGCQVPILGIDTIKVITLKAQFTSLSNVVCDAGHIYFNDSAISNDIVTNWLWNFGDGNTSVQQNPVHFYTSPGNYNINLIVTTAIGCRDSVLKNGYAKVIARPDINIQSSTGRCASDTLIFKGVFLQPDTSAVSWKWDFGNGNVSTLQNPPSQTFLSPGNYIVTAIATNSSGCMDTASHSLTINPLPAINAGNDIFLCLGSVAQLQASGANSYQWLTPANFLSCTGCSNPVTNTPENKTYKVKGTSTFGCNAIDSVNIIVKKPFTIAVFPARDSICIGESVQLSASVAENYLWTPAAGLSSTVIRNPIATPGANILYKVVAFDSANCFKDSAFVTIVVSKYPVVDAGPDKTIKAGATIVLSPVYSNDITSWVWTPATGLSCTDCPAPVAKPNGTAVYTIKVKNNAGCTSVDDVKLFTTCNNKNIFIPNTFSPNGDGVNDIFYPRGTGLNRIRGMKIFNRWGETVFEKSNFYANDPSSGWNGTVGGRKVTSDVYTFVIDIICDNNDLIVQQGTITLIK